MNDPTKNFQKTSRKQKFDLSLIDKCHEAMPDRIRKYLNKRGITDEIIREYKLGWGSFYGKRWITIPIKDTNGKYIFFKLRQDPEEGNEKMTFPDGIKAQIYGWEILKTARERIVICEGEFDRLLLISKKVMAITSTHGAGTFKKEWLEYIPKNLKIYICFDNDKSGKEGALKIAKMLDDSGYEHIFIINLPTELGEGGDITDYFVNLKGNLEDLFSKYAKEYPEKIDTSKFKPLSSRELNDILGITIKRDEKNKLITFLCQLSAFTDNSQFNISFNAPSSTGKSYIPLEIARFFPKEDLIKLGGCSPTAFFHESGELDSEKKIKVIDLSRKILIFLDMPHNDLLAKLRPFLSHDEKEILHKITDKTNKYGHRAKNVLLKGFPAVLFCTTNPKVDEQEATRNFLLSPEISEEKHRMALHEKIVKECDLEDYEKMLDAYPERVLLKERIIAIKREKIKNIIIENPEKIEMRFLNNTKKPKSRHARDVGRLISLTQTFALLNLWFRKRKGSTIFANDEDIEEAFKIWEEISESQELELPPFIYDLFNKVIKTAWIEKNKNITDLDKDLNGQLGLSRKDIRDKHYQVYGRFLPDWSLRQDIIPMLETTRLITQIPDPSDKRKILIYPIYKKSIIENIEAKEERAAIMEFDAGMNREEAEKLASFEKNEDPEKE